MDGDAAQTSGWRVREARPVDAFAIAALHILHQRELEDIAPAALRIGQRAAGQVQVEDARSSRRELGLVEMTRKRIGEGLLDAMLAWAEGDGVSRVQLHALPGVRTIFERFGFGPPSQQLMERQISRRGG